MNPQESESGDVVRLPSDSDLFVETIEQIFEAVSEAILLIDSSGNFLTANLGGCNFLGVARDDLMAKNIFDFLVTSNRIVESRFMHLLKAAEQGEAEFQLGPNSRRRVALQLVCDVADDQHVVIVRSLDAVSQSAITTLPHDRENNVDAYHSLPATEESLQLQNVALNACVEVVLITDRQGTIEWVNPAFTRLTGYTPAEAIGRNPRELVNSGQHDAAFFRQLWQTILSGDVWRGEIVNQRKDGTLYCEKMTITPIRGSEGDIRHFIAVKQDITDFKQAALLERELRERINTYARTLEGINYSLQLSEQRYRNVVEAQTDMICRFWPDGTLTFVNGAYTQFVGHAESALLGHNFLQFVPEADYPLVEPQLAELRQLTPDHPTVEHEHTVHNHRGEVRWQHWVNRGLFDEQGTLLEIQAIGRDITALKHAEQELRDREQQLELFFTQSLDGCFFMMLDEPIGWDDAIDQDQAIDYALAHLRMTRVNQAMLDQYGAVEDEVVGLTLADFFAHDMATGQATVRQLFDAGRLHVDTEERKLDGTPMWIEGDYICFYDNRGYITGFFGVQREVTGLKDAIAALAASEHKYRLLVENQTELVLNLDADGRIVFASPSYCELFDQSLEALIGADFCPTGYVENEAIAQQNFAQVWQPPHTCRIEQHALTRDGWRWLAWSNQAVVDEAGHVSAIVAVGRDITDRKQMEEALRLSEQRFRTVLETLTLVAITLDRDGNIVFCNDYLLALTGWQREEVLHQNWFEYFLPSDIAPTLVAMFEQTLNNGEFPTYQENEMVTRTGDRRLIAWNNTMQRNLNGDVISITSIGEDITDRKQYERHIADLSQRLSLATRSLNLGVWDFDLTTGQLQWDDRMMAIYGLTPDQFDTRYESWRDRIVVDDVPATERQVQAAIAGPDDFHTEFRIRRPDGQIRHIEGHAIVLRDANGQAQRMTGVNLDITERRQQEFALQETTQRLSLAASVTQMGVWELDVATDVLWCDPQMSAIYGWEPIARSCPNRDWANQIHPDDRHIIDEESNAIIQGDETIRSEYRIVRPDGQMRHVEDYAVIVRDQHGYLQKLIGVNFDITDRRQQELVLQETSQRLSLATEAAHLGIWEWRMDVDQLIWDERSYEIYGVATSDFGGTVRDWEQRIHPDDWAELHRYHQDAIAHANVLHTEFRIIRPDGEVRDIENYANIIRDDAGQPIRLIGLNWDITERKRAEQELAETHQQLQALLENSPAIIELFDENGCYQQVNHIAAAFLERPAEDVVGRRFDEIHSPELAALFMERVQEIATNGQPLEVEDRLHLLGEERILRSVIFPVSAKPGEPRLFGLVATDVTALIHAQQDLQRTAVRERLIHEISNNIRCSLDLEVILENAVQGIRQFLHTDRVLVYRFNPDWSGDMIVESVGAEWLSVLGETLRDPCFEGNLIEPYRRGRISQINDVNTDDMTPCHRELLTRYQVQANLVLPVVVSDQLWGLLCIHQCRSPRYWQVDEVTFVEQLIEPVEVAIQQAYLLQETRLQAQREQLRSTITQHIRRSLNLDAILNTTVKEIQQFLKTDRVIVYRFEADGSGDVIVESIAPGWTSIIGSTLRDDCFSGPLVEAYANGKIHSLPDVQTADIQECYRDFLTQFEIQANLALPLVVEGHLWGLLCVHQCAAPRHWQSHEIEVVTQICDQVEIAIQQAQLLEATALQAQREQLFNEIMTAARESLDLQEMMNRTAEKLMDAFQVSRCIISLCSHHGDMLECAATATRSGVRSLKHRPVAVQGNPLVEYVLSAHQPIAKSDLLRDEPLTSLPNGEFVQGLAQRFNVVALLAIAIRYQGQVKGAMMVHHTEPRQWSEADCTLMQKVADQLAIAIQQAELYQKAQTEIAERQRLEEQLRHDAFHDTLTGLPNRALFLERLEFARCRFQQWHPPSNASYRDRATDCMDADQRDQFAVLFLDLDRFKIINDSLGHSFGDQLLQLIASRLQNCLRDVDLAARLGGDEFVVLLEELPDPAFALEVARRIHNILDMPIFLDDREVVIRASIGIAFGSPHYGDSVQILRDADIAMYQAKQSSQDYVVFDASMHAIALQQMNLESDLRHAIKRNEFRLFFQPIVALSSGKIVGFEALVRWQHPTRGLLYPDSFVALAEDTGLMASIDLWVLQAACQQLHQWRQQLPDCGDLTMSVNLSGKQFSQPNLINQIDYALSTAKLDGRYLKLEITESILIENNELAIQTLDAFRDRHIQVCMDDFGTGYSSLSYLHRFPVDILKIDKSFILNLGSPKASDRDYEIVKAIINLALNLNLHVVAEGIENQAALVYLQKHSCQWGQGYHFSPAVDGDRATQFLLEQPFRMG